MLSKKKLLLLAAGASLIALEACSPARQTYGYIADEELIGAIQPGVDNEISVIAAPCNTTVRSTFDESTWYYISTNTTKRSFFLPKPVKRDILAVNFDGSGVVQDVTRYDLADARSVNPRNAKTPTRGRELGFFEQIFGNIGRFSGVPGQPGGPGGPQR